MRTLEEVCKALRPTPDLTETQRGCIEEVTAAFEDLVIHVYEFVPNVADKTIAMRKIVEAKQACIHAITHNASVDRKDQGESQTIKPKDSCY